MNPVSLVAMGFAVFLAVIALLLKVHYDREDKKRLREEEEKVEQAQKGAEYVVPTEKPDGFAAIPDEDWDEYERLCGEYDDLRRQRYRKMAEIQAVWAAKIRPHLRASEHHPD